MINTETTVPSKSKKIRMFPIDFKHIMQNSLPDMMTYLKPYLAQGKGIYLLEPLGLINYNQVVPILVDKTKDKCIMPSVKYRINYDGKSDLKAVAIVIINRYVTWLKSIYQKEQQGDAKFLRQELYNRRRKLFSPHAYADFIANNLATINVEDIDFYYLNQDKSNRILPQAIIYLEQATNINASTINVILKLIDEFAPYGAQTQFAINCIYQVINAKNPKVEVFYDRPIYYSILLRYLTNKKLILPLNATVNTYNLSDYIDTKQITFKLINFSDYVQFLTTITNSNRSSRDTVKEELEVLKKNMATTKAFVLDKSNFAKILQPRVDIGNLLANEDLVLDYLLN